MAHQLVQLPLITEEHLDGSYRSRLETVLAGDLNFHGRDSLYASHNLHSFPAKFPPQLPRAFIKELTEPGELVLDPMVGSGTTIVEAFISGRRSVGFDIDPLAIRLSAAKVTPTILHKVREAAQEVLVEAETRFLEDPDALVEMLDARFDAATRKFIDYWFLPKTQIELIALIQAIEKVQDPIIRDFLELGFSAIIITKSGGVSMAMDLAHTRPHRVADKEPRSPFERYSYRLKKNIQSLAEIPYGTKEVNLIKGNAQSLALHSNSVDLIVTSPPYAANAIDYMRAHKFSLVWFGHPVSELSKLRREYIGGEATSDFDMLELPDYPSRKIAKVAELDEKKARVLQRYYSEMTRTLSEMYRVLKPGKSAIVVVGTSTMRGVDTETHKCFKDIGESLGFELVRTAVRQLDRDKRMMPARRNSRPNSQIEERMHEEYVLGFLKP